MYRLIFLYRSQKHLIFLGTFNLLYCGYSIFNLLFTQQMVLTELFVFLTLVQTFVLYVLNLFSDIQIHIQIHNINVLSRDGGYPDF